MKNKIIMFFGIFLILFAALLVFTSEFTNAEEEEGVRVYARQFPCPWCAIGTLNFQSVCDLPGENPGTGGGKGCGKIRDLAPYSYYQDGYERKQGQWIAVTCYNSSEEGCCSNSLDPTLIAICDKEESCAYRFSVDFNGKPTDLLEVGCCSKGYKVCTSYENWTKIDKCIPNSEICVALKSNFDILGLDYGGAFGPYSTYKMCMLEDITPERDGFDCGCKGSYYYYKKDITTGASTLTGVSLIAQDVCTGSSVSYGDNNYARNLSASNEIGCFLGKLYNTSEEGHCGNPCTDNSYELEEECCCDKDGDSDPTETCEAKVCNKFLTYVDVKIGEDINLTLYRTDHIFKGTYKEDGITKTVQVTYGTATDPTTYIVVSWMKGTDYYSYSFVNPCGHEIEKETFTLYGGKNSYYVPYQDNLYLTDIGELNFTFLYSPCCPLKIKTAGEFEAYIDLRDDITHKINGLPDPNVEDPSSFVLDEPKEFEVNFKITSTTAEICSKPLENMTYEEKQKCGLPTSFEVTMDLMGRYYYSWLAGEAIYEPIKQMRKVANQFNAFAAGIIREQGKNPGEYFLDDSSIFSLPKQGNLQDLWKDLGLTMNEKITLKFEYVYDEQNPKIIMTPTDVFTASPDTPEVYKRSELKQSRPEKDTEKEIVLAEGDFTRELYLGLLRTFSSEVVAMGGRTEFNTRSFRPINYVESSYTTNGIEGTIIIEEKNNLGLVHILPNITKKDFEAIEYYPDVMTACCEFGVRDIPKAQVVSCPDLVSSFSGYSIRKGDVTSPITDLVLTENPDYQIKTGIVLNGISYKPSEGTSTSDLLWQKGSCGIPGLTIFSVDVEGIYYDDDELVFKGDKDIFSKARAGATAKFPPEIFMRLFTDAGQEVPFYSTEEIAQALSDLEVDWSIDDSKRVQEKIAVRIIKSGDRLFLTITDSIRIHSLDGKGIASPLKLKYGTVEIKQSSSGIKGILHGALVETLVKQTYQLKNNPEFNKLIKVIDGGIAVDNGRNEYDHGSLQEYLAKRVSCCKSPTVTSTTWLQSRPSTTGRGLSVYMLRDPANFTTNGKAYMINASGELSVDITKQFNIVSDWLIYRMDDEDLEIYNYNLKNTKNYHLGTGTFYSKDNKFQISLKDDPNVDLSISEIELLGEAELTDEEIEENLEAVSLEASQTIEELMQSLNQFIKGNKTQEETLVDLILWNH